jgi:hypothetical protein
MPELQLLLLIVWGFDGCYSAKKKSLYVSLIKLDLEKILLLLKNSKKKKEMKKDLSEGYLRVSCPLISFMTWSSPLSCFKAVLS